MLFTVRFSRTKKADFNLGNLHSVEFMICAIDHKMLTFTPHLLKMVNKCSRLLELRVCRIVADVSMIRLPLVAGDAENFDVCQHVVALLAADVMGMQESTNFRRRKVDFTLLTNIVPGLFDPARNLSPIGCINIRHIIQVYSSEQNVAMEFICFDKTAQIKRT